MKMLFTSTKFQIIVIAIITLLVYVNTLSNKFVWDDITFSKWELTRSFNNIPAFFKGDYPPPHVGKYRPLKGVILTTNYYLWKLNPIGYHLQAIAIHLAATLLIYFITIHLAQKKIIAFMTAIIFGIHPIHVEAITFITSSIDIVGLVFLLASFFCYLKRIYFLSLIFAFLGFLSNEIALILPFLIIFYDFCFKKLTKSNLAGKIGIYLPYFVALIAYFIVRIVVLNIRNNDTYLAGSFFLTMIVMLKVFLKYLSLLILPLNLNINHTISKGILSFQEVDLSNTAVLKQSFFDYQVIISLVIIIVLAIISIVNLKKNPLIAFCIGWFFIALIPVSNIIPISTLMSERFVYLASFSFCVLVAMYANYLSTKLKSLTLLAFLFLIFFYSSQTILRNQIWKDQLTLFTDTVRKSPESTFAHNNLGIAYKNLGNLDLAIEELKIAVDNNPKNIAKVNFNLGDVYFKKGKFDLSIEQFKKVLLSEPDNYEAYSHLGDSYKKIGDLAKAIKHYNKSITINPDFYDAHVNLGIVYVQQNELEKAIEKFKTAKTLNSAFIPAYNNLAAVYAKQGKIDLAILELKKAISVDPNNDDVKNNLEKLEKYIKEREIRQ